MRLKHPPPSVTAGPLRLSLAAWVVCHGLVAGSALAQSGGQPDPLAAPAWSAGAKFLDEEPHRKTKQRVVLSGVGSQAELSTVGRAINDVLGCIRLFGITGSNLGQSVPAGVSPERLAEIKAARVTWQAFEAMSTPPGRAAMPLPPASGHMAHAIDQWRVESETALSVRVDFRQDFFELKPVKDPQPRILRLRFVFQDGRWLLDGATEQSPP